MNVTVALSVSVKFLKNVFFVNVPVHAVLGFAAVPVSAFEPTPIAVHPVNVYPLLVGLLISTSASYVPLVGAFVPAVPLFNVYDILYVFLI